MNTSITDLLIFLRPCPWARAPLFESLYTHVPSPAKHTILFQTHCVCTLNYARSLSLLVWLEGAWIWPKSGPKKQSIYRNILLDLGPGICGAQYWKESNMICLWPPEYHNHQMGINGQCVINWLFFSGHGYLIFRRNVNPQLVVINDICITTCPSVFKWCQLTRVSTTRRPQFDTSCSHSVIHPTILASIKFEEGHESNGINWTN